MNTKENSLIKNTQADRICEFLSLKDGNITCTNPDSQIYLKGWVRTICACGKGICLDVKGGCRE